MLVALLVGCAPAPSPILDVDADGLSDAAEVHLGTDPLAPDTDRDDYTDGDEVLVGTDPTDPRDRIYRGGWPFRADKDQLPGSHRHRFEVGRPLPRWVLTDPFGDAVDLWDFYGDAPILLVATAAWCGPSNAVSAWFAGTDPIPAYAAIWPDGPDAVTRGDVRVLNVLVEDPTGEPPTLAALSAFADLYPSDRIPVLAGDSELAEDLAPPWFPAAYLLTPELVVQEGDATVESALAVLATPPSP